MKLSLFQDSSPFDVSIDLGTSNLIVSTADGILVNEPTVIAIRRLSPSSFQFVAIGHEAKALLGREPSGVEVIRPLSQGVIHHLDLTVALMQTLLKRALGGKFRFLRPRLLLSLPKDVTEVERRAFQEAGLRSGARQVKLIPEPLAAALGSGLEVFGTTGEMIVDVGAGTTEIALFSQGGLVFSHSLRVGGDDVDAAIIAHLRRQHNFQVGLQTAEEIKQRLPIGIARGEGLRVRGLDLVRAVPASIELHAAEILEAVQPTTSVIARAVLQGLEQMPEELSADLLDRGIVLSGGGCLTAGLLDRLQEESGLRVSIDSAPLLGVAKGEVEILRDSELSRRIDERF